ncbi:MAG: hypothetical protein KGY78_10995 [Anaerolineae bacterium]|nr:hypothetical protein [Anaerolineae bacterium]
MTYQKEVETMHTKDDSDIAATRRALRQAPVVCLSQGTPGCGYHAWATASCPDCPPDTGEITLRDMRPGRCVEHGPDTHDCGCGTQTCTAPCGGIGHGPCRHEPWPELPEAAAREGIGYIAGPLATPDGRQKYTCSGDPGQVEAFLANASRLFGLTDLYGDPARGFAGGYKEV